MHLLLLLIYWPAPWAVGVLSICVHILREGASTPTQQSEPTKLFLIPVLLFKILSLDLLPSQVRTGRMKPSGLKRAVTLVKNKLEGICRHCATGWRSRSPCTGAQFTKDCRTASLYKKYLQLTDSLPWPFF